MCAFASVLNCTGDVSFRMRKGALRRAPRVIWDRASKLRASTGPERDACAVWHTGLHLQIWQNACLYRIYSIQVINLKKILACGAP